MIRKTEMLHEGGEPGKRHQKQIATELVKVKSVKVK